MVEISALTGTERGYAILTNHSPQAWEVRVSSGLSIKRIRQIIPSGFQEIKLNRQSWHMTLDGFSGAIVEWFI
jgi:hypothetical protein